MWPFGTLPTRARNSAMNTLPLAQESQLTALEIELAKVQEQLQQSQQQIKHLQFDLSVEQSKRTDLQMELESKQEHVTGLCMKIINTSNKQIETSRENAELREENEKLRALGLQHLLERNELRRELEKITVVAKNENSINKQVIGASIETLEKVRQVAQQQNAKIEVIAEKAKKFDWLAKHYKNLFNKRI